jgi:hypothetical protein
MTSSKFSNINGAGHEIDLTDFHFTFNDGWGTVFEFSGVGEFKWLTGPWESFNSQKVWASAKISGGGNAMYQSRSALMRATVTATSAGTVGRFEPFYLWYPMNRWLPSGDFPIFVQ